MGFISCLSPCAYTKPDRVILWLAENHWACSRIYWQPQHQMSRKRHFASSARGQFVFLFVKHPGIKEKSSANRTLFQIALFIYPSNLWGTDKILGMFLFLSMVFFLNPPFAFAVFHVFSTSSCVQHFTFERYGKRIRLKFVFNKVFAQRFAQEH